MLICLYVFCALLFINVESNQNNEYCSADDRECSETQYWNNQKLLFYDVNPPEGFNLRRDVYMRLAIMFSEAKKRGKYLNWHLILPPWYQLVHWKSQAVYDTKPLPWNLFFDINSLKTFAPVKEMYEITDNIQKKFLNIDRLYILQNFPNAFENGEFIEKWELIQGDCSYNGDYWGYNNITIKEVLCVQFQGKASKLWELLALHPKDKKIMIAHGEIILHDKYGTKEYWDCRKSMKFNKKLINIAMKYMKNNFGCEYKCNNYISLHWRRQDFARSRYKEVPSIIGTANQLDKSIKKFNSSIVKIFIASDTGHAEISQLIKHLQAKNYEVYQFEATEKQLENYKQGGAAIIEQIICSHAAYFIGTHESTFTFRIQEEREILGFLSSTTFNRLCPDSGHCERMSKWTIIH